LADCCYGYDCLSDFFVYGRLTAPRFVLALNWNFGSCNAEEALICKFSVLYDNF